MQTVKQIAAKLVPGDALFQIAICSSDDAQVYFDRPVAAEAFEFLLLQHAKEFWLQFHWNLADLIEKQRSCVGEFYAADLAHHSPGKCSFLMAEQLAFEESSGNGGAVYFDKRSVAAAAHAMDSVGDQFLAGARLSQDENSRITGGDSRNLIENVSKHGSRQRFQGTGPQIVFCLRDSCVLRPAGV